MFVHALKISWSYRKSIKWKEIERFVCGKKIQQAFARFRFSVIGEFRLFTFIAFIFFIVSSGFIDNGVLRFFLVLLSPHHITFYASKLMTRCCCCCCLLNKQILFGHIFIFIIINMAFKDKFDVQRKCHKNFGVFRSCDKKAHFRWVRILMFAQA